MVSTPNSKAALSMHNSAILASMNRAFLSLALIFSFSFALPAETRTIHDPVRFVAGVYQHFVDAQNTNRPYDAPANIYTPRLAKLFQHDRERAKGEVGCLDFDFWVNGQDLHITNLTVTNGAEALGSKSGDCQVHKSRYGI